MFNRATACSTSPAGAATQPLLRSYFGHVVEAFEQLRWHLMEYHLVPETPQEDRAPGIAKTRG